MDQSDIITPVCGTQTPITSVEDLIVKHEGRVATVYKDSRGIPTIGIGHNLEASPLPAGMTPPLTDAQIDQLFLADLGAIRAELVAALPWVNQLDEVRRAVLLDMAFNMGVATLCGFHHTLEAIQRADWHAAADGMLHSLWARQVGPRATEDARMMLTGLWPT
jgi:lysozyme